MSQVFSFKDFRLKLIGVEGGSSTKGVGSISLAEIEVHIVSYFLKYRPVYGDRSGRAV
jgi:hypothetical protein